MAAGDGRWKPPNSPSLNNQERFAFQSLSDFLVGDDWARFPVFQTSALGKAHYGGLLATPGDHFIATGDATGVPGMWVFTNFSGWMVWDFEEWQYTPASTGMTIGNGVQKATVVREGRHINIKFRFLFGSTTSASGAWAGIYDLPTTGNAPIDFDLPARFDSFGGAVPFPTELNFHGMAEFTDNSPLFASFGGVRIESSTTFRLVTMPTAVSGGATYLVYAGVSSAAPWTWTTNDQIWAELRYVLNT